MTGAVVRPTTEPIVLDIALPAGTRFDVPLPAGHNAFAYVYEGSVDVGGDAAERVDSRSDGDPDHRSAQRGVAVPRCRCAVG